MGDVAQRGPETSFGIRADHARRRRDRLVEGARTQGKLSALSRTCLRSFLDGGGRRLGIRPEDTAPNEKISNLVLQIRRDLEAKSPAACEGSNAPVQAPSVPADQGPDVIVLGHPSSALPAETAAPVGQLCEGLKKCGLRVEAWRDGWKRRPESRGSGRAAATAIFIQPVGVNKAPDLASDPEVIARYLSDAGFAGANSFCGCPKVSVTRTLPPPRRRPTRNGFRRFG